MKEILKQPKFDISAIKLIVALGNPGNEYIKTRHNAGFILLDQFNVEFLNENKFKAQISTLNNKQKFVLAKPTTYMNSSGECVVAIMNFYKLSTSEILIIHDDLDIKLGEYKIQFNRGPKIHNGLISIENMLATTEFWRLRVGIDNRSEDIRKHISGSDYVLGRFTDEEIKILDSVFNSIKETYFS